MRRATELLSSPLVSRPPLGCSRSAMATAQHARASGLFPKTATLLSEARATLHGGWVAGWAGVRDQAASSEAALAFGGPAPPQSDRYVNRGRAEECAVRPPLSQALVLPWQISSSIASRPPCVLFNKSFQNIVFLLAASSLCQYARGMGGGESWVGGGVRVSSIKVGSARLTPR